LIDSCSKVCTRQSAAKIHTSTGSRICHGDGTSNFANHSIYITGAPVCLAINPAHRLPLIVAPGIGIQVVPGTLYPAGDAVGHHVLVLHAGQPLQALDSTAAVWEIGLLRRNYKQKSRNLRLKIIYIFHLDPFTRNFIVLY